jgi:hypothetical protein
VSVAQFGRVHPEFTKMRLDTEMNFAATPAFQWMKKQLRVPAKVAGRGARP